MDWLRWHRANPFHLYCLGFWIVFGIGSLALLPLTDGISIFGVLILPAPIIGTIKGMQPVATHFLQGDLLPGIVVGTEPYTVASITDLSAVPNLSYPTVRILPHDLQRIRERRFQTGDRLPMVARYRGNEPTPKWDSFHPVAAVFATGDPIELAALESRILDSAWIALNEALFQVPQPFCNGLFPVISERSGDENLAMSD